MSVPNILITGANGFLGSNLVKLLSSTGKYKVHAMNGHNYSDESTPADMRNFPYGETKKIGEDLVLQWAEKGRKKGLVANVIRPGFVIYGPYDKNTFINVLKEIDKGRFGFIDKGKKLISYVYVENLCSGIERLISSYNQSGTLIFSMET
ncbi:NAD-dependent epimerase/dehydratase family protein [Spirochaeta isovalerica]|uniref:Nucleoside-diphosphate-sugar epimerase n=1 Tax=Spirochaeta isovalerica TaxID=150 RepID=A0A841RA38_9SPIO|nr:NAD-dependent epimerase/dehydratase family protein [Spirochaeta isovalerica]MBB6480231.1 nucleoside-diphosphate-sugar epimerase [Spirochaeta isovalerica]